MDLFTAANGTFYSLCPQVFHENKPETMESRKVETGYPVRM